ncbi:hypothetical protein CSUI_000997 [Cystoisospora suis]|uniref:Uncharacterized protein n=1 Tax=Cystoisospora suis TaxID=483139 RepID=A0A2C6LE13_9APIC|nr:hypothetical protein CSUI_000997 [Cystoisospora suis]
MSPQLRTVSACPSSKANCFTAESRLTDTGSSVSVMCSRTPGHCKPRSGSLRRSVPPNVERTVVSGHPATQGASLPLIVKLFSFRIFNWLEIDLGAVRTHDVRQGSRRQGPPSGGPPA